MPIKIFTKDFWKGQRLLLLTFLVLHTLVSFYYISQHNITFDEPQYIEFAKHWLHGHPERVEPLDDSKSPIVAICWVPRIVRQIMNPHYKLTDYGRKDQEEGRYMMILFSFMTALYVYWWCKDLYGKKGWWLPLLLLLFDPLNLAYSTLITTDLACGAMLLALLYHFRKYILFHSRRDFYFTCLFAGLGIVTKQGLLFAIPMLVLLAFVYLAIQKSLKTFVTKRFLMDVVVFLFSIVLIINVCYYFHKSFRPFGDYTFESALLKGLQQRFPFLHAVPVPFPESYVQSVDMIKAHADTGAGKVNSTYNGIYLFGELKLSGKFWYYYIVLFFYKMPVGIMLLLLACVPLFVKRFNVKSFAQRYLFILLPIVFFWVVLSFFNQFQSGIRHLLLVFPLLYIGLGYLFRQVAHASIKWKLLTGAAIAYAFITLFIYYPYIIPYTNEFITNRKTVYKKIWDSSVDYGQSDSSIHVFIKQHPGYKRATTNPDTGRYAVVMGEMNNTFTRNANPYKWYRALAPKGHSRYVILLFDISKQDIEKADWRKAEMKIVR